MSCPLGLSSTHLTLAVLLAKKDRKTPKLGKLSVFLVKIVKKHPN